MIPKKIHYVWVGGNPMPSMARKCLQSWQEKLPGFEVVRWDESNSPMHHPYIQYMYKAKKWAFVSDYIRFWVLAREGGIYLDTDSFVLKTFGPELLENEEFQVFLGMMQDGYISCGAIGAVPNNAFMEAIVKDYDVADPKKFETCPEVVTRLYNALKPASVKIFDTTYFNPCLPQERRTPEKLKFAYVDNLYAESWQLFPPLRRFARRIGVMKLLQIGKRTVKKILKKD